MSTPSVVPTGYPPTPVLTWPGYPPGRVPPPPPRCLPHGILGNVAKHYGIWVPLPLFWPGQGGTHVGYPPHRVPPSRVHPLSRVPPWLDLAGYPPPPAGPGRVPPPPPPGVCPMAFWEMLQSIMGYGYPPSPGVDKLTKWNYYLPVVLRTRAVITGESTKISTRMLLNFVDLSLSVAVMDEH